ncbi:hypothetical protein TeGR_g591 [Tetraparma gracilis]|uniref:JmjC domain-containing protein n=1 Tax=Tetraparma gracilis TaxID=2962635 RepID=A0ABQ6MXQ4_9STRA|nr:hypothetical protein TeGR_g591 [Tetraparma gracilis]
MDFDADIDAVEDAVVAAAPRSRRTRSAIDYVALAGGNSDDSAEDEAADFEYENLRAASKGFTEPVVVRGMFSDSRLMEWAANLSSPATTSFLPELLPYNVSVVQNSTLGKDHSINCNTHRAADTRMTPWAEAVDSILSDDPFDASTPSKTLILPPASRTHRDTNTALDDAFSRIVDRDADLARFGGGGWERGMKNAVITQLWVGSGKHDAAMGTGWHADICSSWKVQLKGAKVRTWDTGDGSSFVSFLHRARKDKKTLAVVETTRGEKFGSYANEKWTFIHGKHSSLMRPTMKSGKTAAVGADMSVREEVEPYLERYQLVLEAGDFLYNPDWYWHNVRNEPGLTMALAARECNFTNYFSANPLLSTSVILNHARAAVGGDAYAWERLRGAVGGVFSELRGYSGL